MSRPATPEAKPFHLVSAPKEHVEVLGTAPHAYEIRMGGTLDEFNTARYPETYGKFKRLDSKFQPNHYLLLENVGDVDVVSPRPDFLHPVSPNFDRIIVSAKPEWPLPPGWLVHGRTYHWRLRARDRWGAWSAWSEAWTFTLAR